MSDSISSPASDASSPTAQAPIAQARGGMLALITDGRPRLPVLDGVIDRLTGYLSVSFRTMSRGNADASRAEEPEPVTFAEFMATVPPKALFTVLRIGAWGGQCLAVIDGRLANSAIGLLLGGQADPTAAEPRVHTAIERAVLERLARDLIATDMVRAFAPIVALDVTLDRVVSEPTDAVIARPKAPCLSWRIAVTIDGRESSIAFLLPYASVEPIRPLLSRDLSGTGPDRDPAWHAHLGSELPYVSVKLRAIIERRRVSATEVMRWRVGSTLMLNRRHDEPVDVFCDDLLVLRARMAEQDGRIALHVDERRLAEDWPA
jgi:flagellar motor switch protein FliM